MDKPDAKMLKAFYSLQQEIERLETDSESESDSDGSSGGESTGPDTESSASQDEESVFVATCFAGFGENHPAISLRTIAVKVQKSKKFPKASCNILLDDGCSTSYCSMRGS